MSTSIKALVLPLAFLLTALTATAADSLPFGLVYFGHYSAMKKTGDLSGKVELATLPALPGTWGLGATAGFAGEIIQVDGKILVSPGKNAPNEVRAPQASEQAALFVSAKVSEWQSITIPREMTQVRFEEFLRSKAGALGLSPKQPFPFRVEGGFRELVWHVVTGELPKPAGSEATDTGHASPKVGVRIFHHSHRRGQLVGFYSGEALEGILSHPGERFHLHFINDAQTAAGHVDTYVVNAGAVLKLPKK